MELQKTNQLEAFEKLIRDHIYKDYEVGKALSEIQEKQLYKEAGFERFDEYSWNRFQLTGAKAKKKIKAFHTNDQLSFFPEYEAKYCFPPIVSEIFAKITDSSKRKEAYSEFNKRREEIGVVPSQREIQEIAKKFCNPCVLNPMEYRRVTYLNKKYNDLFTKHCDDKGEKESDFLRRIIEKSLDEMESQFRDKALKNLQ